MIDAAGAIYVIGGSFYNHTDSSGTDYQDVWVSTDGGADRTRWCSAGTTGYYVFTVLAGTRGYRGSCVEWAEY